MESEARESDCSLLQCEDELLDAEVSSIDALQAAKEKEYEAGIAQVWGAEWSYDFSKHNFTRPQHTAPARCF